MLNPIFWFEIFTFYDIGPWALTVNNHNFALMHGHVH